MSEPTKGGRLERAEAWWAFLLRIGLAFFGVWLLYRQATVPDPPGAQLWIIFAGIACIGPAAAAPFAAVVAAARGATSGDPGPP